MPDHDAEVIETVAAMIREVDGNHEFGAAALAEALVNRGVTTCTADTLHQGAPKLDRAQLVGLIEHELERVWDDGNASGLDGWIGPGRGAGEVDAYAVQQRHRDTHGALDRIIARLYPPNHQPQQDG